MASGSAAALALKASVVAAVLAVLVLPSLGRCPSLGPEPPAPAPTPTPSPSPAPAPAPAMSCSDCFSRCYSNCSVTVPPKCSQYCDAAGRCDQCKAEVMRQCTACCNAGQCGCNCEAAAAGGSCTSACSTRSCQPCLEGYGQQCRDDCNKVICATCVNK